MSDESISLLKPGFWCTEEYQDFKGTKKKIPITNIFGFKCDIEFHTIQVPFDFEAMTETQQSKELEKMEKKQSKQKQQGDRVTMALKHCLD